MRTYVDRLHTYACSQTYIDKHTHTFTHALTQSHACIGLRVRILRNCMRTVTASFPMQLQHPSCHHQLLLNLCTVLSQDTGSYTGVLNRFDNDDMYTVSAWMPTQCIHMHERLCLHYRRERPNNYSSFSDMVSGHPLDIFPVHFPSLISYTVVRRTAYTLK